MKMFKILITFFIFSCCKNVDCLAMDEQYTTADQLDTSRHSAGEPPHSRGRSKEATPPPYSQAGASFNMLPPPHNPFDPTSTSSDRSASEGSVEEERRAKSAPPVRHNGKSVSPPPRKYTSPPLGPSRHPTPPPTQAIVLGYKQELHQQLAALQSALQSEKSTYEEWLVNLCVAYMAYPEKTRENDKFKPPATSPQDFLAQAGYELKRLSPDVTRAINRSNKTVTYGIRGTSCSLTAQTTLGSFYNWSVQHYDAALKEGSPWYIKILGKPWGQPFTNCIRSLMVFTAFNFIRHGYYYLSLGEHCPTSFVLGVMSFGFGMLLYYNVIPYIFTGVYMKHVTNVLDTIEKDTIDLGYRRIVTGHSLGGNIAQAVGVFNKNVQVRSISAIGGAYPTCCDMNGRLAKNSGTSRSVCSLDDLQSRTKGLMGAGDPVECLAHVGDIKHVPVEHTGDDSMSAHRLNNIIYALFCLDGAVARELIELRGYIEQTTTEEAKVRERITQISIAAKQRNLEKIPDNMVTCCNTSPQVKPLTPPPSQASSWWPWWLSWKKQHPLSPTDMRRVTLPPTQKKSRWPWWLSWGSSKSAAAEVEAVEVQE